MAVCDSIIYFSSKIAVNTHANKGELYFMNFLFILRLVFNL